MLDLKFKNEIPIFPSKCDTRCSLRENSETTNLKDFLEPSRTFEAFNLAFKDLQVSCESCLHSMRAQDRAGNSRWANEAELEIKSSFCDCKMGLLL